MGQRRGLNLDLGANEKQPAEIRLCQSPLNEFEAAP